MPNFPQRKKTLSHWINTMMTAAALRKFSTIHAPKVVEYENVKVAALQHFITILSAILIACFLIYTNNFVEDTAPFGTVSFSTSPDPQVVNTNDAYCAASVVDGCTAMTSTEALLDGEPLFQFDAKHACFFLYL